MKVCPNCRQEYEDTTIRFCTLDGQPLVERANSAPLLQPPLNSVGNAAPVGSSFSASLATALFAPHFFKSTSYSHTGMTKVPCQENVRVSALDLADNLLMISFWYLSENDLIRLTPASRQMSGAPQATLVVESNPANHPRLPGLEFDLLTIIRAAAPGATVEEVVKQFLPYGFLPHETMIDRLTQWFIQLGYGQPDGARKPFFRLSNDVHFGFIPDCQRIATLKPAAQNIHRQWTKFQVEQPAQFRLLYDSVIAAVRAQKKRHNL